MSATARSLILVLSLLPGCASAPEAQGPPSPLLQDGVSLADVLSAIRHGEITRKNAREKLELVSLRLGPYGRDRSSFEGLSLIQPNPAIEEDYQIGDVHLIAEHRCEAKRRRRSGWATLERMSLESSYYRFLDGRLIGWNHVDFASGCYPYQVEFRLSEPFRNFANPDRNCLKRPPGQLSRQAIKDLAKRPICRSVWR